MTAISVGGMSRFCLLKDTKASLSVEKDGFCLSFSFAYMPSLYESNRGPMQTITDAQEF